MISGISEYQYVFSAFTHLDFRQLLSSLMDTKPLCTIKDSQSNLPVLERASNRTWLGIVLYQH